MFQEDATKQDPGSGGKMPRFAASEVYRESWSGTGIHVTQATLSRDILELGLVKVRGVYRAPEETQSSPPTDLRRSLRQLVVDSGVSGNILMMKTSARRRSRSRAWSWMRQAGRKFLERSRGMTPCLPCCVVRGSASRCFAGSRASDYEDPSGSGRRDRLLRLGVDEDCSETSLRWIASP